MMNYVGYFQYLVHRLWRSKSIQVIVGVSILLISIIYVLNLNANETLHFNKRVITEIENLEKAIQSETDKLNDVNDEETLNRIKSSIEFSESLLSKYYLVQENLEIDDYQKAYGIQIELHRQIIDILNNTEGPDPAIVFFENEIKTLSYLIDENLKYEADDFPINGIMFMAWIDKFISPVVLTLMNAYILSILYSFRYDEKLDVSSLVPGKPWVYQLIDILIGIVLSSGLLLIINMSGFLMGSLIRGTGSLRYPAALFGIGGVKNFTGIGIVLINSFLISMLCIIFTTVLVYIISRFTKQSMPTLIISLFVLLFPIVVMRISNTFTALAHLIPMVYLSAQKIVSSSSAVSYGNQFIDESNAFVVLITAITALILSSLSYIGMNCSKEKN